MCASWCLCDTVVRTPGACTLLIYLSLRYMTNYKKVFGALTILGALAMGGTAFAQTASTTTTTGAATTGTSATTGTGATTGTSATTPTAPNTGAGGDTSENLALLGVSALVAAGGAAYLARSKKSLA